MNNKEMSWVPVFDEDKDNYVPGQYQTKDIYQGENCLPMFDTQQECEQWCQNDSPFAPLTKSLNMNKKFVDNTSDKDLNNLMKEFDNYEVNSFMKVSIGCDHAAYNLKEKVKQYLNQKNIEVNDFGCYSEERCDYPDFAHAVANDVTNQNCDFGILICGSGNGINMTANKWSGIRSALCWNAEIANMARLHNDANILTLPGRYISDEMAYLCVDEFINTGFEGGRHSDRIAKINR